MGEDKANNAHHPSQQRSRASDSNWRHPLSSQPVDSDRLLQAIERALASRHD
jgi:hypothetical protein